MNTHRLAYDPFMFEKTAPFPSANSSKPKILTKFLFIYFFFFVIIFFFKIKYGPRRCAGIGLSNGEGIERLWSNL